MQLTYIWHAHVRPYTPLTNATHFIWRVHVRPHVHEQTACRSVPLLRRGIERRVAVLRVAGRKEPFYACR